MMVHEQEVPGGELLLRFDETFEAADAWKVHEAIEASDGTWPIVLDFSHVQRFQDFAIALIAPDLSREDGPPVRLRGLGLHQQRILEYFGVKRLGARDAPWDEGPEVRA